MGPVSAVYVPSRNPDQMEEPCVCVVGCGYVGRHLVEAFVGAKVRVLGLDVDEARVAALEAGRKEWDPEGRASFRLVADIGASPLAPIGLFCIAVPTNVRADGTVDDGPLRAAAETVSRLVGNGATVVVESSVAVGMTRNVVGPIVDRAGRDYSLGFSPEREGPKIVSGRDQASLARVCEWYGRAFSRLVPVSSLETAEMAKLYENCFRMVNIAYATEAADACDLLDIDHREVVAACATKPFGFMPFHAGLGVGGHCIPVNPAYLRATCELPLLEQATRTTLARPGRMAAQVHAQAEQTGEEGPGAYLVLGVGFKAGEANTAHSPGLALARALRDEHGARVLLADPVLGRDDPVRQEFNIVDLGGPNMAALLRLHRIGAVCVAVRQPGTDHARLARECLAADIPLFDFAGPEKETERTPSPVNHGLPGRCGIL